MVYLNKLGKLKYDISSIYLCFVLKMHLPNLKGICITTAIIWPLTKILHFKKEFMKWGYSTPLCMKWWTQLHIRCMIWHQHSEGKAFYLWFVEKFIQKIHFHTSFICLSWTRTWGHWKDWKFLYHGFHGSALIDHQVALLPIRKLFLTQSFWSDTVTQLIWLCCLKGHKNRPTIFWY